MIPEPDEDGLGEGDSFSSAFERQIQEAQQEQRAADRIESAGAPQGAAVPEPLSIPGGKQLQRIQTQAAQALRPLTDTVWSKLDRKATAVAEFTLRQYRTKSSTWVVLGIGVLFVGMMLMFYAEAMATGYEAYDNDGDSFDWDRDGYPAGQEKRLGTDPNDKFDFPDPELYPPDDPSVWVNEDGFDWDGDYGNRNQGHDDDGDCTGEGWTNPDSWSLPGNKDYNGDGIDCNARYRTNETGHIILGILNDPNVDEDPDEDVFLKESLHRGFVLGFGKIGFVFLIGIFLPLFLATGLIRDEMDKGTLHYIMGKPIARAEVLAYRLIGYLAVVWPYSTVLILGTALITGFIAPSDSVFRFDDMAAWLGILLASWFVMLAYGTIFCTLGVISPKYGLWIAIGLGVWEFAMAMISLGAPNFPLSWLSISHWGIEIVNCTSILAYPDQSWMAAVSETVNWGEDTPITGFYSPPSVIPTSAFGSLLISIFMLLMVTVIGLFIGQASLKRKELN